MSVEASIDTASAEKAEVEAEHKARQRSPIAVRVIGYALLIPMVAMAMVVALTYPSAGIAGVLKVEITYAVALLSFLGGVRWGIALMSGGVHLHFRPLAIITLILPFAWVILFMTTPVALAALMAGYLLIALGERASTRSPVPQWYYALLVPFTIMIEIALGLSLLIIVNF
jgi:hypothetical protein